MATVWDEAEVGAGRAGGPGVAASGEAHLSGREEVPGDEDLARSQSRAPWDVGKGPDCFILVLWAGKLRL